MAITAFTGPPGSGKSHALIKDVILPAVLAGRRVLSNIDGLDADAIRGYCLERVDDVSKLGQVELFHGDEALLSGFWPDEATADIATRVKGGDLVVFDEWALTFPRRGKVPPGCNVEEFLRWHRHLTGPGGQATDVCIATQVPADLHMNFRALVARSYKFKKLTALGAESTYAWLLFDGHLQSKGAHYRNGTGKYDPEIFPLYASSSAAKDGTHTELRTNRKDSVLSGWQAWMVMIGAPLFVIGGALLLYFVWSDFSAVPGAEAAQAQQNGSGAPAGAIAGNPAPGVEQPTSPWRIVGYVQGEFGTRVVVADDKGGVRMAMPGDFTFDEGRPVSGRVDGQLTVATDRLPQGEVAVSPFGGLMQ